MISLSTLPGSPDRPNAAVVLGIGEAMMSLAVPIAAPQGVTPHIASVAGAESNVLSWLAQLGIHSTFISRVGDDLAGQFVLSELASYGLDLSLVQRDSGQTGLMIKWTAPDRSTVEYRRDRAPARLMEGVDFGSIARIRPDIVHITGVTLAILHERQSLLRALASRPQSAVLSFDVNFRPALWPTGDPGAAAIEACRLADVVFVGLDEAEALWGVKNREALLRLLSKVPELVIKDDARDVVVRSRLGLHAATPPRIDVVEPVGAGDAFAAGYLWARLEGLPPERRLRAGIYLAGHALRSTRDVARVDISEFRRAMGCENET